jgi:predicted ATPase
MPLQWQKVLMKTISELTVLIQKSFLKNDFDKFIIDATFPNFKRIAPFAKVDFRFPVTLLVGPNGGGKSSILHALWGMPLHRSTSRFWFSTAVDPIEDVSAGKKNVPRYWYTHYIKEIDIRVQTRKVKANKRDGYWEPSKPSIRDGMQPVEKADATDYRATDRWTPVQRNVEYLNTKAESSAFDRFFYFTALESLQARQEHFLKEAERLREVIDNNLQTKKIGRGQFVFENFKIPPKALEVINQILGKRYISAQYIIHRFYDRNKAPSVIFETNSHTYSESFAGSGELSVVNLVLAIEKLKPFSLLLLDEPETSLHPGAQEELLRYLMEQTLEKKLQIVISTHSPTLVDLVPAEALIVLENQTEGTIVRNDVHKTAAFYRLGHANPRRISILTEDILLKVMVERALEFLEPALRRNCDVVSVNLGVSEMLSHQVPMLLMTNSRSLMVLDGDQQPLIDLMQVDFSDLSPKALDDLKSSIEKNNISLIGINFKIQEYVEWCLKHVSLIAETCPEEVFISMLDPNNPKLGKSTNKQYKSILRGILKNRGDELDSHSVAAIFKSKLGEHIKSGEPIKASLEALALRIKKSLVAVGI